MCSAYTQAQISMDGALVRCLSAPQRSENNLTGIQQLLCRTMSSVSAKSMIEVFSAVSSVS